VANGYFSTIARNDGDVLTLFDSDCQRLENGISTTRGSYDSAALAQGCEAQFKLGYFNINKRVRQRHYFLIDSERGVVVATQQLSTPVNAAGHLRQGRPQPLHLE
jgi:hypothetical protein